VNFIEMSGSEEEVSLDDEKKNPNLMADLFGADESEGDSDSFAETSTRPQREEADTPEEESMSGEGTPTVTTPSSLPLTQRVQESEPSLQRTVLTGLSYPRPPVNAEVIEFDCHLTPADLWY
jgi:hypothetical protein